MGLKTKAFLRCKYKKIATTPQQNELWKYHSDIYRFPFIKPLVKSNGINPSLQSYPSYRLKSFDKKLEISIKSRIRRHLPQSYKLLAGNRSQMRHLMNCSGTFRSPKISKETEPKNSVSSFTNP